MKRTIGILLAIWCSIAAGGQNQPGEVRGIVVDPQGNPVAGATVRAQEEGTVFKAVDEAETDQSGQFTLSNLLLGDKLLIAMKEDDGYPNPYWSFYHSREPIRVTLSRDRPKSDFIRLMLEPKAAVVVGTISDAATGKPLSAIIHMWRADKESDFIEQGVSGQYRILLPADTSVSISVSSPGYQEWFNGGATEASGTASIVISDGHSQELDVKLARIAK